MEINPEPRGHVGIRSVDLGAAGEGAAKSGFPVRRPPRTSLERLARARSAQGCSPLPLLLRLVQQLSDMGLHQPVPRKSSCRPSPSYLNAMANLAFGIQLLNFHQ